MNKIRKFFDELDFEENVHWFIMFLAVLGICGGLYGKYKAGEFNNPEPQEIVEDSLLLQKDSI
tara:strand:- start:1233 stop:1421 length:189 start_codon:yes stop_codon:yes gene_type:complete